MTRKELKALRELRNHVGWISWNGKGEYVIVGMSFIGRQDYNLVNRILKAHTNYAVNKILKEVSK